MNFTFLSASRHASRERVARLLDSYAHRIGDQTWSIQCQKEACDTIREAIEAICAGRDGKHLAVMCLRQTPRGLRAYWSANTMPHADWVLTDGQIEYVLRSTARRHAFHRPRASKDVIRLLEGLVKCAGDAHDIGKNTRHFNWKLTQDRIISDPIRHELLSLELVNALRADPDAGLATATGRALEAALSRSSLPVVTDKDSLWMWALISHHRLPATGSSLENHRASADEIGKSESQAMLCEIRQCQDPSLLPWIRGVTDQVVAGELTTDRLRAAGVFLRAALMFADHAVSAVEDGAWARETDHGRGAFLAGIARRIAPVTKKTANAKANPKQTLSSHLREVGRASTHYLRLLLSPARLSAAFPALASGRLANRPPATGDFAWQQVALDLLTPLWKTRSDDAIFVAVTASTGSGKTVGCAAMAHLLGEGRWTVALNLRSLTLQTGDAYRDSLELSEREAAVLIGSKAHMRLHDIGKSEGLMRDEPVDTVGDAKVMDSMELELAVSGGTQRVPGFIGVQVHKKGGSQTDSFTNDRYLGAPVLVTTVDNIINAGDMRRSRWLTPFLRLATGAVVLDEIDQYDPEDLPALARMLYVVGLLGRPLIAASATLYPVIAEALFSAYETGVDERRRLLGCSAPLPVALVSNAAGVSRVFNDVRVFAKTYSDFCRSCADAARLAPALRSSRELDLRDLLPGCRGSLEQRLAQAYQRIERATSELHSSHAWSIPDHPNMSMSVGIVRFARVKDVLRFVAQLAPQAPAPAPLIKVVVYHSKMVLAMRNEIERSLRQMLSRAKNADAPARHPAVVDAIKRARDEGRSGVMVIIVASPVIETGSDYDADWLVAEPSSSRSLAQCAGRVQRHRKQPPTPPNVITLSHPIRAIEGAELTYWHPGFETSSVRFGTDRIGELAPWTDRGVITAAPCLTPDDDSSGRLPKCESEALKRKLDEAVVRGLLADPSSLFHAGHMEVHRFRVSAPEVDCWVDVWDANAVRTQTHFAGGASSESREFVPRDRLLIGRTLLQVAEDLAAKLDVDLGGSMGDDEQSRAREAFARRYLTLSVPERDGNPARIVFDECCGFRVER